MKKSISILLAFMILMSAFMGLGFTASAQDADILAVTIGDTTTNVKVGDTFRYTMSLTDVQIVNCQAEVNYDSNYVSVTTVSEDDEEAYDAFKEASFPVVYDSVIYNVDVDDVILVNCSRVSQYKFRGEQVFATFEFTANAAGATTISTDVIEMAKTVTDYYVDLENGVSVLIEDYTSNEYITYVPSEDPTDEPTDAPTDEPTDEPTEEPTVAPQKPVKVENIVATPESSTAVLTWDAVEDATKYWVYKQKDDKYVAYCSTTTSRAVISSLLGDTTYQFKVIAVFSDGSMMSLAKADVVEFTTKAPVVIDELIATPAVTSVSLEWDAVENAQKYWIYKAYEEEGPFYVYDATTDLEYTVRNLQPDTTYYFKVVPSILSNGKLVLGEVDAAEKIEATTTSGEVITVQVTDVTSTTATISWPAFENAEKYWVMYSTTTMSTTDLSQWTVWAETTDTTYTFKWREPGKFYHFAVVARYTDPANGLTATVKYLADSARMPYSDGDIITFTPVDDDTVTLTWEDEIGMEKTWVSYIDANGKEVVLKSTTTNTITIDLANYKDYKYALNSLDSTGNVGYITRFGGEAYHE